MSWPLYRKRKNIFKIQFIIALHIFLFWPITAPASSDIPRITPWYPSKLTVKPGVQSTLGSFSLNTKELSEDTESPPVTHSGKSWESDIVLAMAEFVGDRAEAELVNWFIDDMLDNICSSAKDFFKNTCLLKTTQATTILPSRTAILNSFRTDLEYNVPSALLSKIDPDEGTIISYISSALIEIRSGIPAVNILSGFAEEKNIREKCIKASNGTTAANHDKTCIIYFTGVLTQAYLESIVDNKPINLSSFIASILEKLKKDNYPRTQKVADYIKANSPKIQQYLRELIRILKDIEFQVDRIKGAEHAPEEHKISDVLAPAFQISRDVILIVKMNNEVFNGEIYVQAVYIESAMDAVALMVSGHYSDALLDIVTVIDKYKNKLPTDQIAIKPLIRFLPIITDIASAKSKEDVKKIMSELASPIGGWKLKRERPPWIPLFSIGALVGGFGGLEHLKGDLPTGSHSGTITGLFAPVGLDISFSAGKGTVGLFASVLDLGTPVSARISRNEGNQVEVVESKSNIGFAQVVSPGIYFRWGIGKSPFVLGLGISETPKLRTVNLKGDSESVDADSIRFGAFLAIDVMIFPF